MPYVDKGCNGPAATHHFACACREAYVAKLEEVLKAAKEAVDCLPCRCHYAYTSRDLQDPDCPCADLKPLREAIAAAENKNG